MADQNTQDKAALTAITESDLSEVSIFLHNHMNSNFSPEQWQKGISANWLNDAPNHGFMLVQDGKIVGVLCAIYSEQVAEGKVKKFCNPHSWCVLPEHRKRSVDLVLAVIRQQGYHFTMFSPNKEGIQIFSYLKFKPLDNTVSILLNVPVLKISDINFITDDAKALALLPEIAKKCYEEHRQFPWLNLLTFGVNDRYGFIIYKKQKLKRLPCAFILYASDRELFQICWPYLRSRLLLKHGFVTSKIEQRLLDVPLGFTLKKEPGLRKFYLSSELSEDKIQYIYSELMTLDI